MIVHAGKVDQGRMALKTLGAASVCVILTAAADAAPAIPDDVREHVETRVRDHYDVGLLVGVVDAEGEHYFARGATEYGGTQTPGPDTVWEAGSLTKVFTAALLAEMVARGDTSLDATLGASNGLGFLSDSMKSATLSSLATHTSGLPRMPGNYAPEDINQPYADYTAAKLEAYLASYEIPAESVGKFLYSNLGFVLLGRMLEKIGGKTYEELLRERVLVPLGMSGTGVGAIGDGARSVPVSGTALGHNGVVSVPHVTPGVFAPAVGLYTTALDLLGFLAANLGYRQTPLDAALALTREPRHSLGDERRRIGLAWTIDETGGVRVISHTGTSGGYACFMGFAPETGKGVVVFSNSKLGVADIGLHLLNPDVPLRSYPKPAVLTPERLARFEGRYRLSDAVQVQMKVQRGHLTTLFTGEPWFTLYPLSETQFTLTQGSIYSFFEDDSGTIAGFIHDFRGVRRFATRE